MITNLIIYIYIYIQNEKKPESRAEKTILNETENLDWDEVSYIYFQRDFCFLLISEPQNMS